MGEGGDRGWDSWIASPIQWIWTWANSGRQCRTGKPGVLQSMGSQRVRHTEWLNNNKDLTVLISKKMKMLVTQSCPTLCDLMDYSLPGFSVHEISQVRILKWVAISFSRGSSWPRDPTGVSCITGRFFTVLISMVYNRWYSSNMVQRTDYNWLTTLPTNAVYYIFPLIKFISCSAKSCSKTAQTWYYSVVTSK